MTDNRRKKTPSINEELMMNMMAEGVQQDGIETSVEKTVKKTSTEPAESKPKDNSKKIKSSSHKYEELFFKKSDTNARDGKTVYIRPDFHEKLSRIIQVIGQDKISIYSYLDNLLAHHFMEFGDQIVLSFNEKYKPIL